MAGAIGVAAVLLLGSVKLTCPHCDLIQRVQRRRGAVASCARCGNPLIDPAAQRPAAQRPAT